MLGENRYKRLVRYFVLFVTGEKNPQTGLIFGRVIAKFPCSIFLETVHVANYCARL